MWWACQGSRSPSPGDILDSVWYTAGCLWCSHQPNAPSQLWRCVHCHQFWDISPLNITCGTPSLPSTVVPLLLWEMPPCRLLHAFHFGTLFIVYKMWKQGCCFHPVIPMGSRRVVVANWVAGESHSQCEWGWLPLMGAQAELHEVGGSFGMVFRYGGAWVSLWG